MNGVCDKAENCNFAHTVAELEILQTPKYTSMNRKLIEMLVHFFSKVNLGLREYLYSFPLLFIYFSNKSLKF